MGPLTKIAYTMKEESDIQKIVKKGTKAYKGLDGASQRLRTYVHVILKVLLIVKHPKYIYIYDHLLRLCVSSLPFFIQKCDNFRFIGYGLTFSHFDINEISKYRWR